MIAEFASKFMPQSKAPVATPAMVEVYLERLNGQAAEAESKLHGLHEQIAEAEQKLAGMKPAITQAESQQKRLGILIEKSKAQRAMILADLPNEVAVMKKAVEAGMVISNLLANSDSQWIAPYLLSRGWTKRGDGWIAMQRDYSPAGVLTAQQAARQQAALDLAAFRNSTADEFESVCGFRPPI